MGDKIVVMRDGRIEQIGTPLRALRPSGQPVRRRLHRLAGDELPARHAAPQRRRRRGRARRRHAAGGAARRRPAATASRWSSACGPSTWRWSTAAASAPTVVGDRADRRRHLRRLPPSTAPSCRWCSASATTSRPAARSTCSPTWRTRICSTPTAASALRRLNAAQTPVTRINDDTHDEGDLDDDIQPPQVPRRHRRRRRRRRCVRHGRRSGRRRCTRRRSPSSPRRAPSCACCAGAASCRATSTPTWSTSRSSPRRPASRCASTTRAGKTCGRRPRWPPTPAPARTSSCRPTTTPTCTRTSCST